jgi:hypothetical protein
MKTTKFKLIMQFSELDRILSELKSASSNDKEYLMAHFLLLLPQLEALDSAIEDSIDSDLILHTSDIRKIIADLISRITYIIAE